MCAHEHSLRKGEAHSGDPLHDTALEADVVLHVLSTAVPEACLWLFAHIKMSFARALHVIVIHSTPAIHIRPAIWRPMRRLVRILETRNASEATCDSTDRTHKQL